MSAEKQELIKKLREGIMLKRFIPEKGGGVGIQFDLDGTKELMEQAANYLESHFDPSIDNTGNWYEPGY